MSPEGMRVRETYLQAMKACLPLQPCTAVKHHGGNVYPCTNLRRGHRGLHRNPAMIKVEADGWIKWGVSLGFWKDKVPCVWAGEFESDERSRTILDICQTSSTPSEDAMYEIWGEAFEKLVRVWASAVNTTAHTVRELFDHPTAHNTGNRNYHAIKESARCLLCLELYTQTSEQWPLPACKHIMCTRCKGHLPVEKHVSEDGKDVRQVWCPFASVCTRATQPQLLEPDAHLEQNEGVRVLSLCGGGVRGLAQIIMLQKLQTELAGIPITHMT